MQEKHVTVGGISHKLEGLFFVMATQNPLEMEGTYPLPEAQLDRFFFKLLVPFPTTEEIEVILNRTTDVDSPEAQRLMEPDRILEMSRLRDAFLSATRCNVMRFIRSWVRIRNMNSLAR